MSKLSFATLTVKKRGNAIAGHLYRYKDTSRLYLCAEGGTEGELRLVSVRDGNCWSFDSTFGSRSPEDFTDLGKIQVEEL